MSKNRPLSFRERAFCAAYVKDSSNLSAAAVAAGYSKSGAYVAAARLLKRSDVQAEIVRLRRQASGIVDDIIGKALAVVRESRPSATADAERAAMYAEAEGDLAAGLTRVYVIAALMDNLEMGLGRKPRRTTKIIQKREVDDAGKVTVTQEGIQIDIFETDGATVNRAGELLLREVERLEADAIGRGVDGEPDRHPLAEQLEAFKNGGVFMTSPPPKRPAAR